MTNNVFHSNSQPDDDGIPETFYMDIGKDAPGEVDKALEERIQESINEGHSTEGQVKLRNIVRKYKNIFRIRLGRAPPAKVAPMKIRLKEGAKPLKIKSRRYNRKQNAFLNAYVKTLIDQDFVEERTTTTWQSAPLLVLKPGSTDRYLMTVDTMGLNAATVKEFWPMPHLDSEVLGFGKSIVFASMDVPAAYWQLGLQKKCLRTCVE